MQMYMNLLFSYANVGFVIFCHSVCGFIVLNFLLYKVYFLCVFKQVGYKDLALFYVTATQRIT